MASDQVNYSEAGAIAQAMKYHIRAGSVWNTLTPAEKESLDHIATAIARTVVGDGAHWDGIIAYAHAAKSVSATPRNTIERDVERLVLEKIPRRNDGDAQWIGQNTTER